MACGDPGGAKCAGVIALSESFFEPLVAGYQMASDQSFSEDLPIPALRGLPCCGVLLCCSAHQAHRGAPWLGSFSLDRHIRHLQGHPGWGPCVVQCIRHLMGQPLYCSAADAGVWRERLQPLCMTQQYCLASMAAWLSSTGISHHNLLPHIPSIHLSTVNSSPHPGIAPQSLNSSPQPLCHLGYVWLRQRLSDSHSI